MTVPEESQELLAGLRALSPPEDVLRLQLARLRGELDVVRQAAVARGFDPAAALDGVVHCLWTEREHYKGLVSDAEKALGWVLCREDGETLLTGIAQLRAGPELRTVRNAGDDYSSECVLCHYEADQPHTFAECRKNMEATDRQATDYELEEQRGRHAQLFTRLRRLFRIVGGERHTDTVSMEDGSAGAEELIAIDRESATLLEENGLRPEQELRREELNGQVTLAIFQAEDGLNKAVSAWRKVTECEEALAKQRPDGLERDVAQRGAGRAGLVVDILTTLRGRE